MVMSRFSPNPSPGMTPAARVIHTDDGSRPDSANAISWAPEPQRNGSSDDASELGGSVHVTAGGTFMSVPAAHASPSRSGRYSATRARATHRDAGSFVSPYFCARP